MRVLVINDAVSGVAVSGREIWSSVEAKHISNVLLTDQDVNIIDYDVFIYDHDRTPNENPSQPSKQISSMIVERVEGGGVLVIFAAINDCQWFPSSMQSRKIPGDRINIVAKMPELLQLFDRNNSGLKYKTQFHHNSEWNYLAIAQNNFPVSAIKTHGDGHIIILPEFKNRNWVIRELVDRVLPLLSPGIFEKNDFVQEISPDWLSAYTISKAENIKADISSLNSKVDKLNKDIELKQIELDSLERYKGLLWATGPELESVVEAGLNLLGIPAHPKQPVDLACPNREGGELYIEIEGTVGSVNIEKGRQLYHYIGDAIDPSIITGAIIGNPWRKEDPAHRPPPKRQGGLFTDDLTRFANRQGWSLVLTTELFEWVRRYLDGDVTAAVEAQGRLKL